MRVEVAAELNTHGASSQPKLAEEALTSPPPRGAHPPQDEAGAAASDLLASPRIEHAVAGKEILRLLKEESSRAGDKGHPADQLEWGKLLSRMSHLDTDPGGHSSTKELLEQILVTQFGSAMPPAEGGENPAPLESAGEIILRLGVNDRLRKKGCPPLGGNELRQILADTEPSANPQGRVDGDRLAAFGLRCSSYAMDRPGSPDEFCTFELQGWKDTTKIPIRFPTNTKVCRIRMLLSEKLGEMGWGKADPFLMAPDTGDMLPCLLSASQVMALASGPDPESTPVDTLIFFQVLPPRWAQGSSKVNQSCEHCLPPNEAWEISACFKAGLTEIQDADAIKPEALQPGQSWQV
jgi:hypothetical protein